jgi:3-oxoacyl-[acyl-carrier-protein] synthase II
VKIVISGLGWVNGASAAEGRQSKDFTWQDELSPLKLKDLLKSLPPRHGRLDCFSKLGLAAVGLALQDAGCDEWSEKRDIGLIAGSEYGCLESDVDYYATVLPEDRALTSPNLFAYTLPNCFIGETSISYGLIGTNYVVQDNSLDQLVAVKMAWDSLRWQESEAMLGGVLNRPCPENIEGPAVVLPPGAVFFLLEEEEKAKKIYGEIYFDSEGQLFFNGQKVEGLKALISLCTS